MKKNKVKKDKSRYTVRFNEADPRHQVVMAALDLVGRQKASFLADAAYYYLTQFEGNKATAEFPLTPPHFYTVPENMKKNKEKKDKARYTARFNEADPRHQVVMAALDLAGRQKASFLADAAYYYLTQFEGNKATAKFPPTPPHFYTVPENIPTQATVLNPQPTITEPVTEKYDEPEADSYDEESEDDVYDENMRMVVLNGLNAFKS